ncbi:MAG: S8 family serine peptidase [Phycisphaerae bacterium]|nr:S8 family serine peptidase [Phycisphaerae bacterium]
MIMNIRSGVSIGLVVGVLGVGTIVWSSGVAASSGDSASTQAPRHVEPAKAVAGFKRASAVEGEDAEGTGHAGRGRGVRWRSGRVTPRPVGDADLGEQLKAQESRHVVVQLNEIPTAEKRAVLEASGVRLLRYLGGNAYFAKIEGQERGQAAVAAVRESGVIGVVQVERGHKLHPTLLRGEFPDHARFSAPVAGGRLAVGPRWEKVHRLPDAVLDRRVETEPDGETDTLVVYVLFHPDVQINGEAVEVVHNHGGVVRSVMRTINAAVVWVPQANLDALAGQDAVQWIEPALPTLEKANYWSRIRTQAEIVQSAPYNLDGSGVKVMVYDDGLPWPNHPDFGDRVHIHVREGVSGPNEHPTHICGSIGGDGSLWGDDPNNDPNCSPKGVAPGVVMECYAAQADDADLPGFLYTDPGDIEEAYDDAINTEGVEIINNSIVCELAARRFPCEWEGDYGLTSMIIDGIVRGSLGSHTRVVWANGNERDQDGDPLSRDPPEGWCGIGCYTTPPPATAKNAISVGAVYSDPNSLAYEPSVTFFTSWGPTDDGRLKPEVCAPGSSQWVILNPSAHTFSTSFLKPTTYPGRYYGTSSSAAFVSGLCALILQDFQTQFPGSPLPLNSTLKVLLVHTAEDHNSPGPDYGEGYGSVLVKEAIDLMRSGNFFEDVIDHDQEIVFYVDAPAEANSLKATLAWDDVPGALNASKELVNDLDIVAISPSEVIHLPWTLDPNLPMNGAVRTTSDHLNNLEQVVVDSPEEGLWAIRIRGYSIPQGPQSFSIAFTPGYQTCSPTGRIILDADSYGCSATAAVTVIDCDMDEDPQSVDSFAITMTSDTEPAGESVLVTETSESSGRFVGTISLGTTDAPGLLHVAPGDTVTAVYEDAEDANGDPAEVQDTAQVDCVSPVISNVAVTVEDYTTAVVTFETDVTAVGAVHYALSCGGPNETASELSRGTSHVLEIPGLEPNATYFFSVEAEDDAGNSVVDANNSACYTFRTHQTWNDYFTEWFTDGTTGDGDGTQNGYCILFVPDGSRSFYSACIDHISELPVDPNCGYSLPSCRDLSVPIFLDFETVSLYGKRYGDRRRPIFVGTNGYLTFGEADIDWDPTIEEHFRLPRVAGMYDDLDLSVSGSLNWKQTEDRLAVTWLNVFCLSSGPAYPYTFQIEMFYDGKIRISWLTLGAVWGIAGLSEGLGVPPNFHSSDLSGYPVGPCPCYVLTAAADPNDSGSVVLSPPGGRYPDGTTVHVHAQHEPNWHFDHWEGDANGTDPNIEMVMDANVAITAVFEPGDPCYTLTMDVAPDGSGFVEPSEGQHSYTEGTEVEVKATPASGWTFDHWEGDANGTEPNDLVLMDWHRTATAVFVRYRTLTIDVQPDGTGSVEPPEGQHQYGEGTAVPLMATATPPYQFDHWEGDANGTDPNTEVLVDGDKSVTACFSMPSFYELDVTWGDYGYVEADPEPNDANMPWRYPPTTEVTLTAIEDKPGSWTRWHIYDPNYPWDLNYAETDTNMVITVIMNGDRQVGAEFTCGGVGIETVPLLVVMFVVCGLVGMLRRRR